MKIGIIGVGAVGAACALSVVLRGSARELVLIDRTRKRAAAVATDMRYVTPLTPRIDVRDGDYPDLAGAALVMVTAGVNEKTGGATDRGDPAGRLRLLDTNGAIYRDIIPRLVAAAPQAVILVVTDPPDPLADLTRELAPHGRVLSTGTFLDSLRFRVHLAKRLGVSPESVEAQIIGEHGTTEVFLWSSARVAGVPIVDAITQLGLPVRQFRLDTEHDVRFANIAIIEGNDASQYGIGTVSARIAEMVLRDENAVIPIGCYNPAYGVTLSLPTVVGRSGAVRILEPQMSPEEHNGLRRSAETLKKAAERFVQHAA